MPEEEAGEEGHAVGKVEAHDGEVEDGVYGDGVDEHEEAFEERDQGDKGNSSGRCLVGLKDADKRGARETMICFAVNISLATKCRERTYHVQKQMSLSMRQPSISSSCR
jgi:hypothetical protein